MRPKLKTLLLSILCLGAIFGSLFIFKKAPSTASNNFYEPLKISSNSLNGNTIWGGGEAFESIVASNNIEGQIVFYSATNNPTGGLESSTLNVDGVPFELNWTGAGDYVGNDTVQLNSNHKSSSITLGTIGAYDRLYILGTSGNSDQEGYTDMGITINYTDGSSDRTSFHIDTWNIDSTDLNIYSWPTPIGRSIEAEYIYVGSTIGAPYIHSIMIDADPEKLISSIDVSLDGYNSNPVAPNVYSYIYAITGMVNNSVPNPTESLRSNSVTEATATFNWQTIPNATSYRFDLATDLWFNNILPEYNNLYTQDNSISVNGLISGTTYYARIRAENSAGQSLSSNIVKISTSPETAPPSITVSANPNLIQISDHISISGDDTSGIKAIEESLDNGVTWKKLADGSYAERTIAENGVYCYRSVDSYDNLSEVACVTYSNLDNTRPIIGINSNGYSEGEWTNRPVTLSVDNLTTNVGQTRFLYSKDNLNWSSYDKPIIINEETGVDGKIYYFKAISQAGIESGIESFVVRRDVTAPTGEITDSNNGWNQFLNTITFGLFFNETKNFEITPTDELSGINHVEYLVTSEAFNSKESALSADGWETASSPVAINPEGDYILYYKLVDNAGNIAVINTDGIVLDTTKASIQGYIDADHVIMLEDGETYYLIRKLLITDNRAIKTIKINNQIVSTENSIIDLSDNQTYDIGVTDMANNITHLTIKTVSLASLDLNLTDENYKTSDESRLKTAKSELAKIESAEGYYASSAELQIISNLSETYNHLLQQISELKSKTEEISNRLALVPDIAHVTSDNYDDIEAIKNSIINILSKYNTHLVTAEKNSLHASQQELEDKLLHLDTIKNNLDKIDIVNITDTNTIKTEDKAELEELKTIAQSLLAGTNLTKEERATVETELESINELIETVNLAMSAESTPSIHAITSIMSSGYTTSDKTTLETAKTDLENAIKTYDNNYTDTEKELLNTQLIFVSSALEDIEGKLWEETRRTTFPTITITAETDKWLSMDILGVSATDDYGIDKIDISNDGGQTWTLVTKLDSGVVEIVKNGTYILRATNQFGNTATKAIEYHNIDSVAPIVSIDTHGYIPGSWTNHPVTVSAENIATNVSPVTIYYRAVTTADGENDWSAYINSIIVDADTDSKVFEFKAVSSSNIESDIERIEIKKDSVAPSGAISIGQNVINSFLNSITFGLLFNETKTYNLSAIDDHSGVKTIEYLISESELTADELGVSPNWKKTNGTVSVDPNKPATVYYRITDYAGNIIVTTLSGIVFDLPGVSDADITVVAQDSGYTTLATSSGSIALLPSPTHATINDINGLNDVKNQLSNYIDTHPNDVSGIANSVLDDYLRVVNLIEDTEANIATVRSSYGTLGDNNHVTASDREQITALISAIIEIKETRGNHLTPTEQQELDGMLDGLYSRLAHIEEVRLSLANINSSIAMYSIATVTKDDRGALTTLKSDINNLLNSTNLTVAEREQLQGVLSTIAELERRIAEVEEAINKAKEQDQSEGINSGNVTPEDQTTLENAAKAYAEALGVFDSNLSLSELFDINNRISTINSALDILDQVAEFEAMVSRLPNPEDVDYDSRVLIKAAEEAYGALSEYGRSLVGPSLLARYQAVLDSYKAYIEGSPLLYAFETLDVFWWGITTTIIVGMFIIIVRRTHKHYVEADDSDDF